MLSLLFLLLVVVVLSLLVVAVVLIIIIIFIVPFSANRGMSVSMQSAVSRSARFPSSVDSDATPVSGGRSSGGSRSGQSWEMVNGSAHHPTSTLDPRQQQQQQHQQLVELQQRSVTSASSSSSSISSTSSRRPGPWSDPSGAVTTFAAPPAENHAVNGGGGGFGRLLPPGGQKSKTEVIQRRKSEEDSSHQPRSKTEMIRSPQSPPRLAEYMGSHYQQQQQQQQQLGGVGASSPLPSAQTGFVPLPPGSVDLGQFKSDLRAGLSEHAGQGVTSQSRSPQHQGAVQYPPYPYRQTSPAREPASTYDNFSNGNGNSSTVPSMHILSKNGLAGARVVRNNSDSFGNSGGSAMTFDPPQQPGLAVAMRRDGGVAARGSPQEHTDFSQRLNNPTHLDLNPVVQPIRFENNNPPAEGVGGGQAAMTGLDRKCPVCCQDFSHISMDEFQTHVFECFDDAEDANAPETLQPQPQRPALPRSGSPNRVCPMCEKLFPENVTQQFFEGHVQSHFEEADPFEVLHPQ